MLARDRARCDFFARRRAFAVLLDGAGPKPMFRSQGVAATVRPKKQHHHDDGDNNPESYDI